MSDIVRAAPLAWDSKAGLGLIMGTLSANTDNYRTRAGISPHRATRPVKLSEGSHIVGGS
jgi:hypothetical protein